MLILEMLDLKSGILIVVVAAGLAFYAYSLKGPALRPAELTPAHQISQPPTAAPEVSGLKIEDLKEGDGLEAKKGNSITVHYVGTLADGQKFDSSYDRNEPFTFTLGQGGLIPGWEQGILGMKVGGRRKLIVPPELAYGANGVPGRIPPNSTLFFEVELLEVK